MTSTQDLAATMTLGECIATIRRELGEFELLDHWQQGEFNHDVVFRLSRIPDSLGGDIVIVATNCNGGIKEVLVFNDVPDRYALWHDRCPDNPEFEGMIPPVLSVARTHHWFDPCNLLTETTRSEIRPEFRRRQRGGGWEPNYE